MAGVIIAPPVSISIPREIPRPPIVISPLSTPIPTESSPRIPGLVSVPLPEILLTPYIGAPAPVVIQELPRRPKKIIIRAPPVKDQTITKSLPAVPGFPVRMAVESTGGTIQLPYRSTTVNTLEKPPLRVNTDPSALALAYNPKQNVLAILTDIDENMLDSKRSSDTGTYSLTELKAFAKRLGIKSSQPKEKLVSEIKQLISDYKSDLKK